MKKRRLASMLLTATLLSGSLTSYNALAAPFYIEVPDAGMRQAYRDNGDWLNVYEPGEYFGDVGGVFGDEWTSMPNQYDMSGYGIKDLTGIQGKVIDLSNNKISDISQLYPCSFIDLRGNLIDTTENSVALEKIIELEEKGTTILYDKDFTPTIIKGDLTGEGYPNLESVTLLAQYILNSKDVTLTEEQYSLADINDDGFVNSLDLVLAKKELENYVPDIVNLDSHPYLEYQIDGKSVTVTGLKDDSITEIEIPEEIDGLPVVKIANKAFYQKTSITSVTMTDSVIYIGESAFYGCSALENVRLSENLQRFVTNFSNKLMNTWVWTIELEVLEEIPIIPTFDEWINDTGKYDYGYYETGFTNIYTGGTFAYCTSLKEIIIPENVKNIGVNTFLGTIDLEIITNS